jgi:hypothetical protein
VTRRDHLGLVTSWAVVSAPCHVDPELVPLSNCPCPDTRSESHPPLCEHPVERASFTDNEQPWHTWKSSRRPGVITVIHRRHQPLAQRSRVRRVEYADLRPQGRHREAFWSDVKRTPGGPAVLYR